MNAVSHSSSISTGNTMLAAALCAVGIPLAQKPFVRIAGDTADPGRMIWFFEPRSHDGRHLTKDLIAAWHDESDPYPPLPGHGSRPFANDDPRRQIPDRTVPQSPPLPRWFRPARHNETAGTD